MEKVILKGQFKNDIISNGQSYCFLFRYDKLLKNKSDLIINKLGVDSLYSDF